MHRIQEDRLVKWIASDKPKPLVIRGARQVGKSTLIRNFAANHKLELFEINLENHPEMETVFQSRDLRKIVQSIAAICDKSFNVKNKLLFLDEIQATPSALSALRLFFENQHDYFPVIAAGSLLEFTLAKFTRSMPVGRIEFLHMGPMSFEEFVQAMGHTYMTSVLQGFTIGDELDAASHLKFIKLLREYLVVGGMPEVVDAYRQHQDLKQVKAIQQFILDTYQDDFYKYGGVIDERVIRLLRTSFNYIPANIGQKIKYSNISRDDKSQYVKSALDLLNLARVCHLVHHSSSSGLPLAAQKSEKMFKVLFLDIGLMNRKTGTDWLSLSGLDDHRLINEGQIAEQFVGQQLMFEADGVVPPELFYWQRESRSSSAEVDFVVGSGPNVMPVEVKAGKSGSMKSLIRFLYEKKLNVAVRFDLNPPSVVTLTTRVENTTIEYTLISLPIYMAGQLHRLLYEYRLTQ